jgi:hypothetical protein
MPRRQRIDCPHERRPGMAVCLHCLHAERVAAQERRQRILIRAGVGMITFAVITAAANAGWRSLRAKGGATASAEARPTSTSKSAPRTVAATAADTVPASIATQGTQSMTFDSSSTQKGPATQHAAVTGQLGADSAGSVPATTGSATAVGAAAPTALPPLPAGPAPLLPSGRTDLLDSMFAVRTGDTVVVHFDTSPARTRRGDKFDRVVRQTLGAVYGPLADSALVKIAPGALAAPGDLLTELPTRGIHVALPGGYKISLWPETRPGRNGPLVVAYRTVIGR